MLNYNLSLMGEFIARSGSTYILHQLHKPGFFLILKKDIHALTTDSGFLLMVQDISQ